MLRSATLVCTLLFVGGIRIVKKRDTSNNALAAKGNGGTLESGINDTLEDLDQWKASTPDVDVLTKLADTDWKDKDRIAHSLKSWAFDLGAKGADYILTQLNPFLGVVFSLISGLFGWAPSAESKMVERILKVVDVMIKNAISDLKYEFAVAGIDGAMMVINNAGENVDLWKVLSNSLTMYWIPVFQNSCWSERKKDVETCTSWRTTESGGAHLMLEMKFTHLMIQAATTMTLYDIDFEGFAETIAKAGRLVMDHYNTFEHFRFQFDSSEHGVKKGGVVCTGGHRGSPLKCDTKGGKDLLLNRAICERKRTCNWHEISDCQRQEQKQLDGCYSNYTKKVMWTLEAEVKPEAKALKRVAANLCLANSRSRTCR